MCGIAGFVGQGDRGILERMVATLVHRGPDDEGIWVAPGVGLAMRRLSIIDLAGGRQPMLNEACAERSRSDGPLCIVFNGEIYNFRELRSDLTQRGHRFKTKSDTEVILHLYEERGERCVENLRGMFAFALWDAPRKKLLLARDRLGKKPLYYWHQDGLFLFASEIKALLCHPAVSRELDWEAFHHYLAFGYTPASRSIFAGIAKLPPAHTATLQNGILSLHCYWSLPTGDPLTDPRPSAEECVARIRHELREAVRLRLESDVPLGVFLSGGIDSSAVVATMREVTGQRIATFTIGFGRAAPSFDEMPYARMVAQRFETDHHEEILEPKVTDLLPAIVRHFDEPFADSSAIPTFVVAQATARHVKVVLSGIGGDETFAGYPRYLGIRLSERYALLPRWLRTVPGVVAPHLLRDSEASRNWADWVRRFVKGAEQPLPDRYIGWTRLFGEADLAGLTTEDVRHQWHANEDAAARAAFSKYAHGDPVDGAFRIDLSTYLPDNLLVMADRMSMAHSLELRAPFCDHRIVEESLRIPPRVKLPEWRLKGLLKAAFADVLPQEVLAHRKQGFMIPLGRWLRTDLRDLMEDLLSSKRIRTRGLYIPEAVEALKQEHLAGMRSHSDRLWALMMAELWMEDYLDAPGFQLTGSSQLSTTAEVSPTLIGETTERVAMQEPSPSVAQGQPLRSAHPFPVSSQAGKEADPRWILLLSVAGLGDFVMGTPAVRAIRERYPQARIWILTIPEVKPLATRCPYVDEVRSLDLRRSRSAFAWALGSRQREIRQLIRELRGRRFDLAINLYHVGTRTGGLRMAAFLRTIGATRNVGRSSGGRGVGFDLTSMIEGHETDAQLAVVRLLGATPTSQYPELWVTAEDRATRDSLLARYRISAADRMVCLHVGSARPEACWPAERFTLVGQRLAEAGAKVVLFGVASQRNLCKTIANAVPGAVSLAGETSLPVLAALLERAVLLVTNDSGPMHMAAALGIPLVVPFGPATPDRTGPRGRNTHLVFAGTQRPDGSPWWKSVSANVVAEAAVRLFTQVSVRPGATEGQA